jgi:hypothetical protein
VRSLSLVLVAVALLLVPASAAAQQNPFELPPAQVTPEPAPTPEPADDGSVGVTTLYVIAGGLLLSFLAIGVWISRDARRSLPAGRRGAVARPDRAPGAPGDRVRVPPQAKAAVRAKRRVQRASRKRNR